MSNTRNLADLLDSSGDIKSAALDNVTPTTSASDLTSGTLAAARIANNTIDSAHITAGAVDDAHISGLAATKLTGTIAAARLSTATTQSASDNSTKIATTAYTDAQIATVVDSAPGTLNTLNELAAALGDDANFSTTVTNSIAAKLPLAGGTMTGNLIASGASTPKLTVKSNDGTSASLKLQRVNENDTSTDFELKNDGGIFKIIGDSSSQNEYETLRLTTTETRIYTGNTERMRIDSSGKVGIGVTSPAVTLELAGNGGALRLPSGGELQFGGSANMLYGNSSNNYLRFNTNSTERMRIDSSGLVSIGIANAAGLNSSGLALTNEFRIHGGADGGVMSLATLYKAYQLGSGDKVGGLYFTDATSGVWAGIQASADGQGGGSLSSPLNANDYPGRLEFLTTPDGSGTPTERMRINSSGNVGIGTASPNNKLTVQDSSYKIHLGTQSSDPTIHFTDSSNSTSDGVLKFYKLKFKTDGGVTNMLLDQHGNLDVKVGNLVIGTAGKGIDFSANSHASGMTSEVLDDYEEGTFTPSITGGTGAPSGVNWSYRYGRYTKIGNQVTVWLDVYLSSISSLGSGQVSLTGLPFTSNNWSGLSAIGVPNIERLVTGLTSSGVYAVVPSNDTRVALYLGNFGTGGMSGLDWSSHADGNTRYRLTATYSI